MLYRLPSICKIRDAPGNLKHKELIQKAIKLQTPLLEEVVRKTGLESPAKLVCNSLTLISIRGKVSPMGTEKDPEAMALPLPEAPHDSTLKFSEDVFRAWDKAKMAERLINGIPSPWSNANKPESRFFSRRVPGRHQSSKLTAFFALEGIKLRERQMHYFSLLQGHLNGKDNFGPLSAIFEEKVPGEELRDIELRQSGSQIALLGANGTKMISTSKSVEQNLKRMQAEKDSFLRILAVKLSLGFNEDIWPKS